MELTAVERQRIMDDAQIIAFTGPRDVRLQDMGRIYKGFDALEKSLDYGKPIFMHNGCASGFDTLAYGRFWPHELINMFPHPVYTYQLEELLKALGVDEAFWQVDQRWCEQCFKGVNYEKGAYQKRNEHMVDSSKMLVYYNPWRKGGTQNCLDYAKGTGIEIVNIFDL